MSSLFESYHGILQKLLAVNEKIERANRHIEEIKAAREVDIPARLKKLEEQIEQIDEYRLQIDGFRKLAEKNLESLNLLTIEAPPGYRINLNRLRQWAMMIDPTASNDPYAQRVYLVAKCDEHFLDQKRVEFEARVEELKQDERIGIGEELDRLEQRVGQYKDELRKLASGEEISAFAGETIAENSFYWYESAPHAYANADHVAATLAPGARAFPMEFPEEQRPALKERFGKFYDADSGSVLLPVELSRDKEFAISVVCSPARGKQLDRGLQNLLLSIIEGYPAGKNRVYILDGVRYNSAALGAMRLLEDSFAVAPIPRNPEQLTSTLEQIVSSFSDLDDILELCDSVAEYNKTAAAEKQLPRTTVVVFGWPNSFSGRDRDYLQRIMTNYERYGVSFVCVSYRSGTKQAAEVELPEYAEQNALHIRMLPRETSIRFGEEKPQGFVWYTLSGEITEEYSQTLRANAVEKEKVSNSYLKHFDTVNLPELTRAYKKIELPYGIDAKGNIHSVSFENENFAAYLVGASRSGKSTLLHTLITGLIRNYHPDNLELWLADFKQLEFKKYIEHCPPHVKYILLDESTELVYDLLDKLTDKMMERQRLFARLGVERIDQLDLTALQEPVPVIFVVLDEFSIMSQAIAESETYRLRLQNLLAKGAALGIKFLFSSQTFTTGVAGLTPTARAQIQQRIAMKGTKEEISETLELSANLRTEQINNWIEALPPHYALVKYRVSADALPQVNRVLVMYIPDYLIRDEMIERINGNMKPAEKYQPQSLGAYVDKHPVIVDGAGFESFEQRRGELERWREISPNRNEYTGEELFLNVGTPRRMVAMMPLVLAPESRENVLLLGGPSEMACTAAIAYSAMKSILAQGGETRVWAYGRNRLFRTYRAVWDRYDPAVDIDALCREIAALKERIVRQEEARELIVLFGIERICGEFELVGERGEVAALFGGATGHSGMDALMVGGGVVEQDDSEEDLFAFFSGMGLSTDEDAPANPQPVIVTEPEEGTMEAEPSESTEEPVAEPTEEVSEGELAEAAGEEGPLESDSGEGPAEDTDEAEPAEDASEEESAEEAGAEEPAEEATEESVSEEARAEEHDREVGGTAETMEKKPEEKPAPEAQEPVEARRESAAYNAQQDLEYILRQGSRLGYHFLLVANSLADAQQSGLRLDMFHHRMAFQIPSDDSWELFNSKVATALPLHICQYSDSLSSCSFRPYLHREFTWEGWSVDEQGKPSN